MALWRAEIDPTVLSCAVVHAAPDPADAFDLARLPHCAVVIRDKAGEHLLISEDSVQIRLDVRLGTVLEGPVRLQYDLSGRLGVEAKLLTLHRLLALTKLGRVPSRYMARESIGPRWALALRALDARRAGASYREIAEVLFGERRVATDWKGQSDYLRSRLQRLIRTAEQAVNGRYRKLLWSPRY